ncbi:hypothetical protein HMPREF9714_03165 [Myroides odoratimimus CCUG 12901]|uniref:Uncharacterized protein n=2 Tax=Myroides odoratimimus TaxID=76832 RepID=A0A0U3FD06_9FLAO|nr:hypothetical protein [Myroides odoratimimus]ALU25123.1 hypothetical protein AS202_02645 [Myroides odoratimimus]EHO05758.1 hypothetical protein HMPREF9714_03165 [Myroides odoratimimus CCUG 12901]EHO07311.1 hypothetical protein HMPREF9712_02710 [Myroides odoratimimus CCUG 10230]MCO7722972.1 hypothetical protein [Myroides odoratimimus]MDM1035631.1 hypothetical protein [Myroides odoratimimus]
MSVLKHWTFITMLVVGGAIYTAQRLEVELPSFINNYVNDILSIPLTMAVILVILRLWKGSTYQLSPLMITSVVLYYTFYFEYYLPQHTSRYTADLYDIGCYILGGILFYLLQQYVWSANNSLQKKVSHK